MTRGTLRKEETMKKFLETISGKAVEGKVKEYSEVYGEVLLGLHRDLQQQARLLDDCRQRLDSQMQAFKEQEMRVSNLQTKISDINLRHVQFEQENAVRLDELRSTIEQFRSEASTLMSTRETLNQLAEDMKQQLSMMPGEHTAQAKQIQQLRLIGILSYVFAFCMGVAIWLLR